MNNVWAVSRFGAEEMTVAAADVAEAVARIRQRASEGDEKAAALMNPDKVELIVSIDVC